MSQVLISDMSYPVSSLLASQHSNKSSNTGNSSGAGDGKLVHLPALLRYHFLSSHLVGCGVGDRVGSPGPGQMLGVNTHEPSKEAQQAVKSE